ncbi:hypothetical protein [Pseudaestuariivita atlantica]|uniref:Lipoprotein n=1 Tax=Pseudaestuariivita atlantica TaxID=1317121 RepID=A0A0L1JM98_9RHOB|nr:hypothetical protein [Pseudaestuariivita atlantica]KNG92880.1 hypothetical protein ATO11_15600 [Pseudaestuariivita atlantica]
MNQSNKILTVSYGTFSCTLEGFEDSFDTMKAIAEYFRDLAADDRYFGAEPPTPDAEMLARIAEKEIARRVEAHSDTSGIHLRAATPALAAAGAAAIADETPADDAEDDVTDAPAEDEAIVAEADADVSALDLQDEDDGEDGGAEEASAEAEEAAEEDHADIGDADEDAATVAEADADDMDAEAEAQDAEADAPAEDAAATEPEEAPEPEVDLAAIAALTEGADHDDEDGEEEDYEASVEDAPADLRAEDEAADEVEAEVVPEPAPAPAPELSSVAAKLARIRQVVSRKGEASDDGFTEDEHAEADTAFEEPGDLEDMSVAAEAPAPADTIANVLDQMQADDEDNAADEDDAPKAEAEPAPRAPIAARVIKVKRTEFEKAVSSGMLEEVDADDAASEDAEDTPEPQPAAAKPARESTLSDADEADLQAALAAVAAEAEEPAEDEDEDDTPDHAADMTAGMDAYEDDDADEDYEDEDDAMTAAGAGAPGRDVLMRAGVAEHDDEVSRLLDKADSEMAEPSGRQRRNAISHLRAAVAATREDEDLARDPQSDSEAYRNDLDEVVRPRRPVSSGSARDARPDDVKPAPLQLVAEQRIDSPAEPVAPVRPRRVSALSAIADGGEDETLEIDGDVSFAEFAEEMGASELPDLLEAAAAYMRFVEKRDAFSRPQLMTKVRSAESVTYSREDRLRSFGVLLREGKIEKTQGGQFTASDRIGYRPDDDREAG